MEKLNLTTLRKRLYQVVDEVLETGVPVEIERHGRTLLITPAEPAPAKLSRLKRRRGIVGDPEDFVHLEVAQWREPDDLS